MGDPIHAVCLHPDLHRTCMDVHSGMRVEVCAGTYSGLPVIAFSRLPACACAAGACHWFDQAAQNIYAIPGAQRLPFAWVRRLVCLCKWGLTLCCSSIQCGNSLSMEMHYQMKIRGNKTLQKITTAATTFNDCKAATDSFFVLILWFKVIFIVFTFITYTV